MTIQNETMSGLWFIFRASGALSGPTCSCHRYDPIRSWLDSTEFLPGEMFMAFNMICILPSSNVCARSTCFYHCATSSCSTWFGFSMIPHARSACQVQRVQKHNLDVWLCVCVFAQSISQRPPLTH